MLDRDLKLLAIFQEVDNVKSVSLAAENLGMARPTVSMGLRKLRKRFNDPLLSAPLPAWNPSRARRTCGGR